MYIPVGSAKQEITPPLTIPYLGYNPRQSYFQGVHDPLYARAMVCGEGEERIGILSVDALGLGNHILGPGRHLTDELRGRIQTRCGLKPERMMVSCTHSHATPETLGITRLLDAPAAAPWLETLLDQLASVVQRACAHPVPCTLKAGKGTALGVAYNRRSVCRGLSPEEQAARGKLDTDLQVLVCEDTNGNARHVLLNFQCHPVVVQVQPLISADFPGVAAHLVEQNLPGNPTCLFLQGAAGDLNPIRGDTRDFRDVTLLGTMVAGEALKVAAHLLGEESTAMPDVTLQAASERLLLPPRSMPDRAGWQARLEQAQEELRSAKGETETYAAGNRVRQAREALVLVDDYSEPKEAEAQALRIGDLAVVSTPGEMFTEYGLAIKRESPAPHTFVVELANGWNGYLLNPGGFAEGGYEAACGPWTQTGEEGAALLTDSCARLLRHLWREG